MTARVVQPSVTETAFNCPHCGAYAAHEWSTLLQRPITERRRVPYFQPAFIREGFGDPDLTAMNSPRADPVGTQNTEEEISVEDIGDALSGMWVGNLHISQCCSCRKFAVWVYKHPVYPPTKLGPEPNPDLPADIQKDYEEARTIVNLSPRGAAALLRLGIQKLCVHLGEKGKNLDDDIASLVAKGLDELVQRMWDIVRVTGNQAVHPGEMNLKDDPDTVVCLFGMVNLIAEKMVSVPKSVNTAYSGLPPRILAAIETRNAKALGQAPGGTKP